jgi:hypothetical protein
MNAEQFHDALSLLSDDLLEPVDQLRQKKSFPWRSIAALAACACLVVGFWALRPDGLSAENSGAGIAPEQEMDGASGSVTEKPESSAYLSAVVLKVEQDHITVLPGDFLSDIAIPVTVQLTQLDTIPPLKEGQRIKLYYKALPENGDPLVPYRIEIIEE